MADVRRSEAGAREPSPRGSPATALPAMAAVFNGLGIARFSYTPMIPAMVGAGWFAPDTAAYLGATNLAGYLLGALLAHEAVRRVGLAMTIRAMLVACVLGAGLLALPWGVAWFAPWRFITGVAGGMIVVLAPPALLGSVDPARRGLVAGLAFSGVGIGIIFSGTAVPALAQLGISDAWLGLGAVSLLAAIIGWGGWGSLVPPPPPSARTPGSSRPLMLLIAAYATDAFGFVPHSLFLADYVARGLDRGLVEGGHAWVAFGVGAACGPLLLGKIAGWGGFGRTMIGVLAVKATAVALPLVLTATPAIWLSAFLVGALTPGIALVGSGTALEITGPAGHAAAWRLMTVTFAVFQAVGGYALSYLFGRTHDYELLFALGGGAMAFGTILTWLAVRGR